MLDIENKKTLKCMIIGSAIYNVLLIIISVLFFLFKSRDIDILEHERIVIIAKYEICVVIGFIVTLIFMYSMALAIEKAVSSNDEGFAKKHMVVVSMVRKIAFCILFVVIIKSKSFGLTGGILFALSALGIKVGAYLTPYIKGVVWNYI